MEDSSSGIDTTELVTELNQDPDFDITGTIEETVSLEESEVVVIDYADNFDELSDEQQASLSYEVSEGEISNQVISSSQDFTVPTGIYELMIKLEDGNSNAISFRLRVQPNDVLSISIDGVSTSLTEKSTGDVLASADGSQASGSGSLLGIGSDGIGSQGVSIAYFDQCPTGYTNVHSDFDPELLPESSLYLTNGVPDLKINFQLPEYYFNIEASYGSEQCPNNSGNVVSSTNAAGCNTIVHTSVNHQDDCNFDLIDQGNGKFIYQGVLTISAKLLLNINGYSIERTVQAPLSWQVELANEISVTSDVEVKEDALCYSNNDCTNDQGCCEDGLCNCDCGTSAKTGYAGDLCQNDVTAPVCDSGCVTHTLQSYHGGSLNAFDRGLYDLPVFSDNSGDAVTVVSIQIDGVDVNDQEYSFPIGSTTVTYTVKDDSDNETSFTYTIVVEDKRAPEVDCHDCQGDALSGQLNVCEGTASGWNKVSLTAAEYETLVSDPSILSRGAVNPSYLPGQDISNSDNYGGQLSVSAGHLDCDCVLQSESESYNSRIITNSWESWPSPSSHDIEDGSINVASAVDPNADGEYDVEYTATDAAGNQGTCTKRGIIYDINDPSCENNFYAAPIIDVNDKNYSVAVPYDEAIFNPSYGISGVGSAAYLDPARNDGDAYHVGYARDISYTSTYHLEDGAGNTATCSWEVFVDNPNPCIYPVCDDEPPTVENCPTSYQFECNENENCGCGKWTPPTFKDDKFVKDIKVYIDGVLFETYDNTGSDETGTSHAPNHLLKLGASNITYVAQDMHGKTARCQFEVTIVDQVKPDFTTCPSNETLNTSTQNADYTYSVDAADGCVVNQDVTFGVVGDQGDANDRTDVQVSLPIGTTDFHFTATDSSNNKQDCRWSITVVDNEPPVITCPANIVDRLEQGTSSKVQTFTVTATDTGDNPNPSIVLSHESGSSFPEGITTVIAVATDDAGNTATCSFEVQHERGYPFATFEAALVSASVNEDGGYGADLEVYSFTNVYHRVDSIASADNLSVSNIAPTSCEEDAAVCQQNWGFRVSFDQCKVEDSSYDFTASVSCLPSDCSEAKTFDFTVILDVANFCWQDLESVSISASLGTTSKANHDAYMIAYDADPSVGYTSVTAFDNGADISGIISVTSDQVELSNVDIVSASRQHYSDADRTVAEGSAKDVLQNEVNKATVASFTYQENDVALESTYYTTYTATVEVSYNFGGARRRMLLSTDDSEASTQKIVTAETVSFGTSETIINPEDAVVVLKLNQCSNDDSLVQGLTNVIAQALRIDSARVNVLVSESTCFVQVSISQLDCDVSDINDVLSLFETAITDPFHDIHTIMYQNDDISMDITFDYGTFFVSQSPVVNNSQAALFGSSSNDSSSSLDWYVYLGAGLFAGIIFSAVFLKARKN